MNKYTLSNITKQQKTWSGDWSTFYRIQALRDIPSLKVKSGDLGGWVEGTHNLSQLGDCWIFDDAQVADDAYVTDNAQISGNAKLSNRASAHGNVNLNGNVSLSGHAVAAEKCTISDNVQVWGYAYIGGSATLYGNLKIYEDARIEGSEVISGNATFIDTARVNSSNDYVHIDQAFTAFQTLQGVRFVGYADPTLRAYTEDEFRKKVYKECFVNVNIIHKEKNRLRYEKINKGIDYALSVLRGREVLVDVLSAP